VVARLRQPSRCQKLNAENACCTAMKRGMRQSFLFGAFSLRLLVFVAGSPTFVNIPGPTGHVTFDQSISPSSLISLGARFLNAAKSWFSFGWLCRLNLDPSAPDSFGSP